MERFLWIVSLNLLLVFVMAGSLSNLWPSSTAIPATRNKATPPPPVPQATTEAPEPWYPIPSGHLWEGLRGDLLISALVAIAITAYAYSACQASRTTERQPVAGEGGLKAGRGIQHRDPLLEPADHPGQGLVVPTLIGPLRISTTHEVGKLGDYLCHLYFNSRDGLPWKS